MRLDDRIWRWAVWILPLLGFWAYGLFDLDEGFYGAITAEMLRRHEWITPLYNGQPWFEKPILVYWLAMPCVKLFGPWIGARFSSVLCTLLCLHLVRSWVSRWLGPRSADAAAAVLATSVLFVGIGRMLMTDMPLTLCLSACFLTFYASLTLDPRWRWASAFALGASVLAKGPVGGILFVGVAGITYWREPELRPRYRGQWLASILIFFATVASWYLPAYLKDGHEFVQRFLIEQNLQRFTGGDAAHNIGGVVNSFIYLPILLIGMAPWSGWIFRAWPHKSEMNPESQFLRFCGTWALTILVFFSISGTKLPNYIVPAFPPLAIVVGDWFARRRPSSEERWRSFQASALAGAIGACVLLNVAFIGYYRWFHAEIHDLANWAGKRPGTVAMYQMSRRELDLGTGGTELKETSHPSVVFYLDRVVPDVETLAEIDGLPSPVFILTRPKRLGEADAKAEQIRGRKLSEVHVPGVPTRHYALLEAGIEMIWAAGAILVYLVICANLARGYVRPPRPAPVPVPPEFHEVRIPGPGYVIPTWATHNDNFSKVVFVLVHGFGGSRLAWLEVAWSLHQLGYDAVIPAMAGQTESPRRNVGFGPTEADEVLAVCHWLRQNGAAKIVLLGVSLGGAACWLAGAKKPSAMDAIVTEGGFSSLEAATNEFMDHVLPFGMWILRPVVWFSTLMTRVPPKSVRPDLAARSWRGRPGLIIHGTLDQLFPIQHADDLMEASGCPQWIVPDATHAMVFNVDPVGYLTRLHEIAKSLD